MSDGGYLLRNHQLWIAHLVLRLLYSFYRIIPLLVWVLVLGLLVLVLLAIQGSRHLTLDLLLTQIYVAAHMKSRGIYYEADKIPHMFSSQTDGQFSATFPL